MSSEPREYLRHILAEADYLSTHSRDLSFDAFRSDETLCRAFVRSLEIIGEATKKCLSTSGLDTRMSIGGRWPVCETD
jgi:uncharacterized protein with HEPN domain